MAFRDAITSWLSQARRGAVVRELIDAEIESSEGDLSDSESALTTCAILATVPHLATKADVTDVRSAVAELRAKMAARETALIKWMIATVLAAAGLAFAIAKFVH